MEITAFTASDKRGNRGKIPIGFPGLSCLHCQGRNCTRKAGRYFPASIRVLSNQTTLFVMYNHLRGCESIPEEVKRSLIKHYNRHRKENQHKTRVVLGGKASFFKGVWDCLQHQSENPLSWYLESSSKSCREWKFKRKAASTNGHFHFAREIELTAFCAFRAT